VIETEAVPTESQSTTRPNESASVGEVIEFVKTYAKQETVDPIKEAGRWLGFSAAAAVLIGFGLSLVVLGLLRLIQTEVDRLSRGAWSWAPYAIVFAVCIFVLAFAAWRLSKAKLDKELP
jgi:MFS family permease